MREYFRKTLDYATGNVIQKIILLFLLPVFSHFMIPEEYAVYTNLLIFISYASLIYLLGFQQALFSYFYHEKTPDYQYTLINTVYITLSTFGLFLSILIILFRRELSLLIVLNEQYSYIFILLGIIIFFDVIFAITMSILNMMESSRKFAFLTIIKHSILLVLIVGGAIFNRFTVTYVFQYLLVSSVISALLAILVMQKIIKNFRSQIQKKITFSYDILRNFLGFGIVMIPGTLALISMRVLDRYMLTYLSPNGLYDAGIYAIGYRIGVIIQFLVSIVSLVYFPYAMRIADQSNARKSYRKIYNYFIFFGCLLGVIVILFSQEIFRFFIDEAYFEASRIVFVGVISTFLHGVFNILNIGFYIKKIASKIAIAVICGALLNIFLNYLLIPRYGIYGAGVTSILAYIFIVIFSYFKSRKVFKVDYNLSYVLIALMILLCLAFLNFLIPIKFSYFVIKIMFIVILGLVSILLKKQDIIEQYHILKSGK